MPDFQETTNLVSSYLRARVPLVIIESIEPSRVMDLLRQVADEIRSMNFFEHSRTEGIKDLLTQQSMGDDTSLAAALDQARVTFKARRNVNFVLTDVEDLADETSTSRHLAEMVRLAEACSGSIILIESNPVWTGLGRLGMSVALDVPTTDELAETLQSIINDQEGLVSVAWGPAEVRRAAEILTGVTETEAVNVLMTMLTRKQLGPDDLSQLSEYKDRILGALAGIERIPLREDYSVGGLRQLQSWLVDREFLMKADLSATRLNPPKGVLLVGVPGCGKSLSAKAIAHSWGLPLYRLDMAGILGMYVGQSESRLREALAAADRVAPCVLWVDEIEKALATSNGEGGTTQRLIGQFLYWLQESTSKTFLVATANDVSALPPELLRKGRFDEMFFVDLPDADDRAEIIELYFDRYLEARLSPALLTELVRITDGFSGSDIDSVVHSIASRMFTQGTTLLPPEDELRPWFVDVVPYSRTNHEDVAHLRAWANGRCLPAGTPPAIDAPAGAPIRRLLVG
ncbi:AAA family ATPase [Tessaracoccus palaemonis]|uniref:Uncharacterized AAA domain-containing protein ycf46 n=1 Tax=Tessaracoccus palaemonis TaxID=2829499 RepID=A0ABX8SK76_9ACTN|nr:AAA family ATPase [Tessaracoccus palaemonis]QXT63781.1 AAA family ATPase [Tessaracoccus palaemonis]